MYKLYKITINSKTILILAENLKSAIDNILYTKFPITNIEIYFKPLVQDEGVILDPSMIEKINNDINNTRKKFQNDKCQEMKKSCPKDSEETDPILFEDWCDIPYKEYVKNDSDFHECYRLSNLLQHFEAGLTQKKNNNNNPKWPKDPITRKKIPIEKLVKIYNQAQEAEINIPPIFSLFVKAVYEGLIDESKGMAPEEDKDHVSKEYNDFISSFNEHVLPNVMTEETITEEALEALEIGMI